MSKSLRIEHGDLVVGSGRAFDTVAGKEKLFQDLKLWILERIGTDPSTPTYGSRLDGGVENGVELQSFIGEMQTQERLLEIKSEIVSLLNLYQATQLEKMKRELVQYGGRHTLSDDEVLHTVDNIEMASLGTTVIVRVTCSTLAGTSLQLTIPTQV